MTELRPAFFTAPYYPAEKSHNSVIGGWEVSLAHSLTDLLHTPPNPLLSPAVRFIQIKMSSSFLTWFNTFFNTFYPPPEEGLGLPQVVRKVLKSKWVGESPYFLIDFVLWNLPLPSFFLIFFLNHGNSLCFKAPVWDFQPSFRCLACRWSPLSPSWWRVALTSVHSPPISNRNRTSLTLLSSRRRALNCRQLHPKGAILHRQVPQPLLWYSWGIGLNFAQNLCRSLPSHVIEIKSIALYYQYGFSDIE